LTEAGLDANAQVEILDIAAARHHAVVGLLVRTGTEGRVIIAGWGSTDHGQISKVPEVDPSLWAPKRPAVLEPRLIWDWKTPDPASIRCKVRAGDHHTVVLVQGDVDGKTSILRCIGSNKHGQCAGTGDDDASAALLKYGVTPDHIADVTCNWTTTHFLVSRQDGDARTRPLILSCGSNDHGQIGNASRQSTSSEKALVPAATNGGDFYLTTAFSEVEKLVSGSEHSLILGKWHWESSEVKAEKGEKQVWGWGWNEHGNLAQGIKESRPVHDEPMLLLAPKQKCIRRGARHHPVNIWAGYGTTYVLAEVEEVDKVDKVENVIFPRGRRPAF
jgi:alpha-tubulin suppressor-like RCC1 family protein